MEDKIIKKLTYYLKISNRISLSVMSLCLLIILILIIIPDRKPILATASQDIVKKDSTVVVKKPVARKPFTFYKIQLSRSNIFRQAQFSTARTQNLNRPTKKNEKSVNEVLKNLSVTGVIIGDDPSVFVYDTSKQNTYLLKVGQSIQGINHFNILQK